MGIVKTVLPKGGKKMTKAANKSARLLQIEALLLEHPEGLSQAEIAQRVGVQRLIGNYSVPTLMLRWM